MSRKSLDRVFDVEPERIMDATDFDTIGGDLIESDDSEEVSGELMPIEYKKFEDAEENIRRLVMKGEAALDDLMAIAKSAESARGYEVVADMLRTLNDMNKGIIENERAINEENAPSNVTNNNTLIVGNASEVLDLIRQKNGGATKKE